MPINRPTLRVRLVLAALLAAQPGAMILAQNRQSAAGWTGGGGAEVHASREAACEKGAERLSTALGETLRFTGQVRAARAGNGAFCEYAREGKAGRLWSPPVYDLAKGGSPS